MILNQIYRFKSGYLTDLYLSNNFNKDLPDLILFPLRENEICLLIKKEFDRYLIYYDNNLFYIKDFQINNLERV